MIKKLQLFRIDFIEKTGFFFLESATRDVLYKKVFLEISQNSQENTGHRKTPESFC